MATIVVLAVVLAACSGVTSASRQAVPTRPSIPTTSVVATTSSAPTVTTQPTSLHIGATATVTNSPYAANVTLVKVLDHPTVTTTPGRYGRPAQETAGNRFVALEFAVTNVGGTVLYDGGQEHQANLISSVVTADGHAFYAVQAALAGCPPLFGLQLTPGGRATRCDVFQVVASSPVVYASVDMTTGIVQGNAEANWAIP